MNIRRWTGWALSAGVGLILSPLALQAQSTSTTTTTGTSSTSTASTSSAGGTATSSGVTSQAAVPLDSSTRLIIPVPVLSIAGTGVSATTIPSTSNSFGTSYVSPLSLGLPSIYTNTFGPPTKYPGGFAKGLYLNAPTTNNSSAASTTTNAGTGFSTQPTPRNPAYYTVLASDIPTKIYAPSKLNADLNAMFAKSTHFKDPQAIQVQVVDGIVLLRGQVASERERDRAEGLLRLTPGVRGVQNELQIAVTARN
jgi:hypothetical protein